MISLKPTLPRLASALLASLLVTLCGVAAAQTNFTLTRVVAVPGTYEPATTIDITIRLDLQTTGTITALGLEETIPDGWTYNDIVGGDAPAIAPIPGVGGLLEFAWFPVPEDYPVIFTYRLNVPIDSEGVKTIRGEGLVRILDVGEIRTRDVATVVPPTGTGEIHSADTDASFTVSLSELLRVIQLYNLLSYRCADPPESTEDGYVPGASGGTGCTPHASDYNPQDWAITLSELLRLIQFFNLGGYYGCDDPDSEDGFCLNLNRTET